METNLTEIQKLKMAIVANLNFDVEKAKQVTTGEGMKEFTLKLGELTDEERQIILKGCLINYNRV